MDTHWAKRLTVGFLVLVSLAVYIIWGINFATGAVRVDEALSPTSETTLPILHYLAEFMMATVTLVGAIGLARTARWGAGVSLLGLGMFVYSAVNSFGWAVVNDLTQGIPMLITLVAALFIAPYLVRRTMR